MIPGTQHGQMRERCGAHAARQEQRRVGALEQRQLFADLDLIGVVAVAGIQNFGR